MTSYYFTDNEAFLLDALKEAGITPDEPLKQYAKNLTEYLANEYNAPMSYFLGMTEVANIHEAYVHHISFKEFADDVIREAHSRAAFVLI